MKIRSIIATTAALVIGVATPGGAHEDAVLKSSQSTVPAGGAISILGTDFQEGARYSLRLAGALREYELRTVAADSAGEFSIELMIAAVVVPGVYKIEAIAADGDVVARLDMTVLPADPDAMSDHAQSGMVAMARSDDIQIDRARSLIEWGLIGLLIGAAAVLGAVLLRNGGKDTSQMKRS